MFHIRNGFSNATVDESTAYSELHVQAQQEHQEIVQLHQQSSPRTLNHQVTDENQQHNKQPTTTQQQSTLLAEGGK